MPVPWETIPRLDPIPRYGEKHINAAQNMLYIAWMVMLGGHSTKINKFRKL